MDHTEMHNAFYYAVDASGLSLPIRQWPGWDDYQGMWTMGGEL